MIHVEHGPWWSWNERLVTYEIDEINTAVEVDLLRMDTIEAAVRGGRAFFVTELRPPGMPEAAAREWLERRIASLRADDSQGSGRFDVRPIFSAQVRADGPLPNPMMSYTAQVWACLPPLPTQFPRPTMPDQSLRSKSEQADQGVEL